MIWYLKSKRNNEPKLERLKKKYERSFDSFRKRLSLDRDIYLDTLYFCFAFHCLNYYMHNYERKKERRDLFLFCSVFSPPVTYMRKVAAINRYWIRLKVFKKKKNHPKHCMIVSKQFHLSSRNFRLIACGDLPPQSTTCLCPIKSLYSS